MENQIVVFELGSECYGVQISAVESIIRMQPVTRIPHSPQFVEGVTNLRGKVLPVVDLRKRFSLETQRETNNSRIIVVNVNDMVIGMIVDAVSEVLTIQDQMVEPPPSITASIDSAFIKGIAKIGERLVILLDLAKILSLQEQESLAIIG